MTYSMRGRKYTPPACFFLISHTRIQFKTWILAPKGNTLNMGGMVKTTFCLICDSFSCSTSHFQSIALFACTISTTDVKQRIHAACVSCSIACTSRTPTVRKEIRPVENTSYPSTQFSYSPTDLYHPSKLPNLTILPDLLRVWRNSSWLWHIVWRMDQKTH